MPDIRIDDSFNSKCLTPRLSRRLAVAKRRQNVRPERIGHSQDSLISASIALIYLGLRDNERAMIWLNKAYQARFNPSMLMRPVFDPLRSDPQF